MDEALSYPPQMRNGGSPPAHLSLSSLSNPPWWPQVKWLQPVFPVEDADLTAPELLDVGSPPVDPGDTDVVLGNAITTALRRMDEKWTTILTNYNNVLEEKRSHDDAQRRYDEETRNEQRQQDHKEQRLINAELRTVKRLDFEVLLASSKNAFATEMKATFDGFRPQVKWLQPPPRAPDCAAALCQRLCLLSKSITKREWQAELAPQRKQAAAQVIFLWLRRQCLFAQLARRHHEAVLAAEADD